mmetsp:Transcript_15381/g.29575  ORF Transcript_15381/g.29575 Transcript_15381/m.29575 type:complete len:206 (+) Transcript_15381:1399-2016(+)
MQSGRSATQPAKCSGCDCGRGCGRGCGCGCSCGGQFPLPRQGWGSEARARKVRAAAERASRATNQETAPALPRQHGFHWRSAWASPPRRANCRGTRGGVGRRQRDGGWTDRGPARRASPPRQLAGRRGRRATGLVAAPRPRGSATTTSERGEGPSRAEPARPRNPGCACQQSPLSPGNGCCCGYCWLNRCRTRRGGWGSRDQRAM